MPISVGLSADTPIEEEKDDLFRRARLVQAVAQQVMRVSSAHCVIVGLQAPWGTGKTSFLNLMARQLAPVDDRPALVTPMPIVIRFNPWMYTSAEELVRMFFVELSAGIGKSVPNDEIRQEISRALLSFAEVAGASVALLASAFGLPEFAAAATGLSITAKGFGKVGTASVKLLGDRLARPTRLPEMKEHLNNKLGKLPQRVVVFVDDIDRLEPEPMRQLLRMVRLTADFTNVTYVLAYDRAVVERVLDSTGIKGRDYLEKIVQVSFEIPEAEPSVLLAMLVAEIWELLAAHELPRPQNARWSKFYRLALRPTFRNARSVKRFVNKLAVALPAVHEHVETVDFLAINLLRLNYPTVYDACFQAKALLTNTDKPNRDALSAWADGALELVPSHDRDVPTELLRLLFPVFDFVTSRYVYGAHHRSEWRREGRICHAASFDTYFLLDIPKNVVTPKDVRNFIAAAADESEARAALFTNGPEFAVNLLEALDAYYEVLTPKQAEDLAKLMMVIGDELVEADRGEMDVSASLRPARVILRALRTLPSFTHRFAVLAWGVSHGSLFTMVREVSLLRPPKRPGEEVLPKLVEDSALREVLESAVADRLKEAAESGELWARQSAHLPYLLYRWSEIDRQSVTDAVAKYTRDAGSLISFLEAFLQSGTLQQGDDPPVRMPVQLRRRHIEFFTDAEEVAIRLQGLADAGVPRAAELLQLLSAPDPDHWGDG